MYMCISFTYHSLVHKFLDSSSGINGASSMNDKSFDLLFDIHFISLDPNTCYISLTSYINYRAKQSQWVYALKLDYTILLFKS